MIQRRPLFPSFVELLCISSACLDIGSLCRKDRDAAQSRAQAAEEVVATLKVSLAAAERRCEEFERRAITARTDAEAVSQAAQSRAAQVRALENARNDAEGKAERLVRGCSNAPC
jgi:chromosome segregation ATPase